MKQINLCRQDLLGSEVKHFHIVFDPLLQKDTTSQQSNGKQSRDFIKCSKFL